jgi:hypothetical protein
VIASASFDKTRRVDLVPENLRITPDTERPPLDACLVVDKTAAVVFASPSVARDLFDYFRNSGLPCSHLPGHRGSDLIDFGNPSADEERRIRALFTSWRNQTGREDGSSLWCVILVLLVVALWFVSLLLAW